MLCYVVIVEIHSYETALFRVLMLLVFEIPLLSNVGEAIASFGFILRLPGTDVSNS